MRKYKSMLFVLNTTNIAEKISRTWGRRGVFADKLENIINVSCLNYNFTEKKKNTRAEKCENSINSLPTSGI